MSVEDSVPKAEIEKFVDNAIRHWRRQRDVVTKGSKEYIRAAYYIDAYQSVRVRLLGGTLPPEE